MNLLHCALPPQYPTANIHPNTIANLNKWKNLNPELDLQQRVYNYEECCDLIEKHFDKELLDFFKIQPYGHFKSDLWRLCALYIDGGVYADIDQELLVPFKDFFDDSIDFCGVTNMEKYNLSNGFIYAKKESPIIQKNIELTYNKYRQALSSNQNLILDVKFIGGCYIMGDVIADMNNSKEMPIGNTKIANLNCKFLYETGDISLRDINKQAFWNSFAVFDKDIKIMNSRYESYYIDRHQNPLFIPYE